MARIPLHSGSRIPLVTVDDDAVLLRPPPSLDPLRNVAAAVGEALRYPLSGSSIGDLITPRGRVTIVVESPSLPLPRALDDPRQEAVAAVVDELERLGMPAERHTILIAGGLERRAGRRQLEAVLRPTQARDFRGTVAVHDASSSDLLPLEVEGERAIRINEALLGTDLVVCVTAAETSDRGGPCALLGACGAETIASTSPAPSLLAPSLSATGVLAGKIEAALARRSAVMGVSLVLDHPRRRGSYSGYPSSPEATRTLARSPIRRLHNLLPGRIRELDLERPGHEITTVAVLAGPPAVAHAEALLRGVSLRGAVLAEPLDTIIVPLSWMSLHSPRETLNPITAAATGLGHALRLWRGTSPLREGGTIVLLHDFRRTFEHGPQAPYRSLFNVLREGAPPERLVAAREQAAADPRAIASYREGTSPHPVLPYADWASCAPAIDRAGSILVAGCRDATTARALGFVPSHNTSTALAMARGVAGGNHRIGVFLAPPYAPVIVSQPG